MNKHNKYNKSERHRYFRSYYLDHRIAKNFSQFCRLVGLKISDALEQAMTEFMETHAKKAGINITIVKPQAPVSVNLYSLAIKEEIRTLIYQIRKAIERKAEPAFVLNLKSQLISLLKKHPEVEEDLAKEVHETLSLSRKYISL